MQIWFKILRNAKPYSTTKPARRITSIQTHCTWCESVFVRVRVSVHSMLIQFSKKQRREGLNCLPQTRSWRERVHDWRWLCTARSSNRIQLRGEGIGGGDQSEIRIGETKRDSDLMRRERVFALCVCASSVNFQRNKITQHHRTFSLFFPLCNNFTILTFLSLEFLKWKINWKKMPIKDSFVNLSCL